MDPFVVLHEYIHPSILQYMSGRDLLTMTEVSPLWKEIVEETGMLEKKIRLKVDYEWIKELSAVYKSHRKYEVIDVTYAKVETLAYIEMLERFAASVTDLSTNRINNIGRNFWAMNRASVDFPNLKRLNVSEDSDWLTNSTSTLEEVIAVGEITNEFLNVLLMGQKKLKVLDISTFDFKLGFVPEFALKVFRAGVSTVDFTQFVHPQRQTLEEVQLRHLESVNHFIQLMNEFPQLTKLCITEASLMLTEQKVASISVNTKITHLALTHVRPYSIILSKLPNLTHLKLSNLTSELLELIVLNMPQLKKLTHVKDSREEFNALRKYEQLKRENGGINQNIEIEMEVEVEEEDSDDSDMIDSFLGMLGIYESGRRQ